MPDRLAQRDEIARGILLLGVLHVHVLIAMLRHVQAQDTLTALWVQVKVLAPHVALFFALAGLSSQELRQRSFTHVASRSLMLVVASAMSHGVGVLLQYVLWTPPTSAYGVVRDLTKPLVYGSGHWTFVTWFLVALAAARLFAYALVRRPRVFVLAAAGAAAAVALSVQMGLPDNLYEWRHWPAAFVMFMVGMALPRARPVPARWGLPALVLGMAIGMINRPGLLGSPLCITCEAEFVASTRWGQFGVAPLYLLQELLALIGLLWLSQWACGRPVGRLLAWFGRHSLALLLLHGWVILSAYGLFYYLWSGHSGPWIFALVFVLNVAVHVLLFRLLRRPLQQALRGCSMLSRWAVVHARHGTRHALRRLAA